MNALAVVAVIGIVAYVIGRQILGEPLRGKRLIVLPAVLMVAGVADLGHRGQPVGPADIVLIVLGLLVAAGIGLKQGLSLRLESRNGALWGQLPPRRLWLWVALVVSHGVLLLVAFGVGAHVAAGTGALLLALGVNRLAQAAVVAPRAWSAGIPLAAERDGSSLFSGIFGEPGADAGPPTPEATPTQSQSVASPPEPYRPADRPSRQDWHLMLHQLIDQRHGHTP
jgi:hypothetical protein